MRLAPQSVTTVKKPRPVRHAPTTAVLVTVLDGDTDARIRGARVTIGRRSARSDRNGVAKIRLSKRRSLLTAAVKPGYEERFVRLPFAKHRKGTIRIYRPPAVADGRVFFGSYDGVFYAVRASDGVTLWSYGTGGPISGAAAVVDGVAYAGSFAHRIVGIDVRSGRVVLDFPHGRYVPVSGGGRGLLLHGYSRIYGVVRR